MDASFLIFLAISALVIATPGPDTALTVRNALLGGRRAGIFTALGVSVGQVGWAIATSVGLVALLLASEPVFRALKLLGAAYLIFLGVQSVRSALLRSPGPSSVPAASRGTKFGGSRALRQGVINDLANPRMAVFFASVLPQFAPEGQGMLSALVALGLVFAALTFVWLALYSVVVARAGAFLRGSRVRRAIDGTAGIALIGLGIKVAVEERWVHRQPKRFAMVAVICCTVSGSFALADETTDRQITESALRETRDIISRELFGHYDITNLVVLKSEAFPDRMRRGPDYGLVTVTLRFSSKRNTTRHPSLNAAMFERGSAMCQSWLYLHCGVAGGHVFDGSLQVLLAVDRDGSWRAVSPHWRSRRKYPLQGYLLLEGREKEGYVLFPKQRER